MGHFRAQYVRPKQHGIKKVAVYRSTHTLSPGESSV